MLVFRPQLALQRIHACQVDDRNEWMQFPWRLAKKGGASVKIPYGGDAGCALSELMYEDLDNADELIGFEY